MRLIRVSPGAHQTATDKYYVARYYAGSGDHRSTLIAATPEAAAQKAWNEYGEARTLFYTRPRDP